MPTGAFTCFQGAETWADELTYPSTVGCGPETPGLRLKVLEYAGRGSMHLTVSPVLFTVLLPMDPSSLGAWCPFLLLGAFLSFSFTFLALQVRQGSWREGGLPPFEKSMHAAVFSLLFGP